MRVIGSSDVVINEQSVIGFFEQRAKLASNPMDAAVTMLQDNNRHLVEARNLIERSALTKTVAGRAIPVRRTLDVGCGSGRLFFADRDLLGLSYLGVDGARSLVEAARRRLEDEGGAASSASFHFHDLSGGGLLELIHSAGPFDLILFSGILIYLNDETVGRVLAEVAQCAAGGATFVFREPVGIAARLSLVDEWSGELGGGYSAIYRTRAELRTMVVDAVGSRFGNWCEAWLYDDPMLNNRTETRQAWMTLSLL